MRIKWHRLKEFVQRYKRFFEKLISIIMRLISKIDFKKSCQSAKKTKLQHIYGCAMCIYSKREEKKIDLPVTGNVGTQSILTSATAPLIDWLT